MTAVFTAEPTLGQTERERDTDLSTKRGQLRYLVDRLGVSRAQANNLIRAYERDVADARRIGNDTERSDADFIDWLMRQAPGGRRAAIRKHEWRVAS